LNLIGASEGDELLEADADGALLLETVGCGI